MKNVNSGNESHDNKTDYCRNPFLGVFIADFPEKFTENDCKNQ